MTHSRHMKRERDEGKTVSVCECNVAELKIDKSNERGLAGKLIAKTGAIG